MPRVVHFDIQGEDPEKLKEFYETVFEWKFEKWEGPMEYWMIMTGDKDELGIDGGLSKKGSMPSLNTIDVKDIDDYIEKVKEGGGEIVQEKMPIPSVGWFAVFKDPQGNSFGLMEEDKEAK